MGLTVDLPRVERPISLEQLKKSIADGVLNNTFLTPGIAPGVDLDTIKKDLRDRSRVIITHETNCLIPKCIVISNTVLRGATFHLREEVPRGLMDTYLRATYGHHFELRHRADKVHWRTKDGKDLIDQVEYSFYLIEKEAQ